MVDLLELTDEQLLWSDPAVFTERKRKSASALVRVATKLRGRVAVVPGSEEFLAVFDDLAAAPVDAFSALWSEPFAYWWARTAEERLQEFLAICDCDESASGNSESTNAADRGAALARHLELIKLFAIGLAARRNTGVQLRKPLSIELPTTVLGSPVALTGTGRAELCGVESRHLVVRHEGRVMRVPLDLDAGWNDDCLSRELCPQIDLGEGVLMRMQPHALKLPGFASTKKDPLPTTQLQYEFREAVVEGIAAIARNFANAFPQLRHGARIVVLKRCHTDGPNNASFSRFPGAVLIGACKRGLILAEDLIHEVHHNRLYALEEGRPFFDNRRVHSTRDARFYSPWRGDARPLYGVFHAVYVFTRVMHFWLNALRSGDLGNEERDYAVQRFARLREQLTLGANILDDHADFTPFGGRIFAALRQEIAQLIDAGQRAGVPEDPPAIVCQEDGSFTPELGLLSGSPVSTLGAVDEHRRSSATTMTAQLTS